MIPIQIDTTDLQSEFNLTKEQVNGLLSFVVKGITIKVAKRWEEIASKGLHQTRDIYVRSLIVGDQGPYIGFVKLSAGESPLPNMLEQGCTAFDLKEGFSHSSKIKIKSKGGWYLTIPFQFAGAGALGESPVFTGVLPKEIEKVLKQKIKKSVFWWYFVRTTFTKKLCLLLNYL